MVRHRRAPGVEHGGETDLGAEMLGIGGDRAQSLGGRFEQHVINHGRVLIGDLAEWCRQGEDDVVILDRQKFALTLDEPLFGRAGLTLWTMAVATGVIGNLLRGTLVAAQNMTAERGTAAALDGRHRLELAKADLSDVATSPRGPVVAEDIRHLQRQRRHQRRSDRCVERQILQRAFHLAQEVGGNLAVACGILEFLVAEQHLDDANVLVML